MGLEYQFGLATPYGKIGLTTKPEPSAEESLNERGQSCSIVGITQLSNRVGSSRVRVHGIAELLNLDAVLDGDG
jgi:hypothetical protein